MNAVNFTSDLDRRAIMVNQKLIQYRWECDEWLRAISFLLQECVFCKNRLAQIAKYKIDNSLLEVLEYLQTLILEQEGILLFQKQVINGYKKEINFLYFLDSETEASISDRHQKIRADIAMIKNKIGAAKTTFNEKLLAAF